LAKDAKVVPVTTHIENDFALPSIDAFREKINDRTRAILICNPGNPTGIIYTREELEALRDLAKEHDLFLIADEVYREFAYDSSQQLSILGFDGVDENVIVIDSISKRFSACGARIGCVISRNTELMDVIMKMAQARLSPPTFGQMGAEAAYQLPASYYQEVVDEYRGRRDVLKESLAEIPGVVCPNINGAFYAMVQLPVESAEDFCHWLLDEFEHEGKTVMLAPGAGFYATPGLGADQVRIAYVLNQEDLRSAMACLAAGLKAYRARTESIDAAS
jgi:aspartate aminotransferase